jgi:uncharacterized protein with NRDE domain
MSLIAIAWRAHPDFPLIILMNQDGPHQQTLTPAAWSRESPRCFAARDAENGTALGVTADGRFAMVTPYRDNQAIDPSLPAITQLPVDYLTSDDTPVAYVRQFIRNRGSHPPFNLIVGSTRQAHYAGTHTRLPLALTQGVHTLSNGLLDEKWPKCEQMDNLFGAYLKTYGGFSILLAAYPALAKTTARDADKLPKPASRTLTPKDITMAGFAMLADRTTYTQNLPKTGVNQHEEERLSSCFVMGSDHGTKSSSVLVMSRDGQVRFEEHSFDATGKQTGVIADSWEMDPAVFSAGGD